MTRNYSEKTINGILDYVGGGKGGPVEVDTLERFYQVTKGALEEARNEVTCSAVDRSDIPALMVFSEALGQN